jgi:hypothetical protein
VRGIVPIFAIMVHHMCEYCYSLKCLKQIKFILLYRQQLVDSFNELNIESTIQTILYGNETSAQNVKLVRAVHSFIKRSKRFDNNIVI